MIGRLGGHDGGDDGDDDYHSGLLTLDLHERNHGKVKRFKLLIAKNDGKGL